MGINEAASLLAACKPLCEKLVASGANCEQSFNYELEKEDLTQLWGFYKVTKAGFGYNDQVRRAAGLERSDLNLLNFVLACQI
ncbi:MAG: hypothetical protein WCS37_14835 [Chloroflexota bacterium]|nr:hypothetical protein [Chloroflexota bacterium]